MTAIRNGAAPGLSGIEQPLTARSVMASLLLGMHPPRMRASQLVRWCALFGIAEGTARVALHRMVARGDLTTTGGTYELSGGLAARQDVQDWSLAPAPLDWSGTWRVGVVDANARPASERQSLRDAMRRLRFVELREGVWLRPDNLPDSAAPPEAARVAGAQCRWFAAQPDGDAEDLVALFAPQRWADDARSLRAQLERITDALAANPDDVLAEAFILGASALAHVRADPFLPLALLTEQWPGGELRDAYHTYQDAFATAVADWFAR
jgi:phenylacetic acid degradation operon negative regulatory protein